MIFLLESLGKFLILFFQKKNKILNFEPITLKIRVYLPKLFNNDTFTGKIYIYDLPNYVEILNLDEIKNKEFIIKDKYEFNLNIKFNNKNYYSDHSTKIYFSINDISKKTVIIKFIRNQLGKPNIKHAKNLIKFHDSNNIIYSQFDCINLEEEYYNKYKFFQ